MGSETPLRPEAWSSLLVTRPYGDSAEGTGRGRSAGRGGGRRVGALCPGDPGGTAEAGYAEGDAGAASAAQGREGAHPAARDGYAAGGCGHAGERGLEEGLEARRRDRVSAATPGGGRGTPSGTAGPRSSGGRAGLKRPLPCPGACALPAPMQPPSPIG